MMVAHILLLLPLPVLLVASLQGIFRPCRICFNTSLPNFFSTFCHLRTAGIMYAYKGNLPFHMFYILLSSAYLNRVHCVAGYPNKFKHIRVFNQINLSRDYLKIAPSGTLAYDGIFDDSAALKISWSSFILNTYLNFPSSVLRIKLSSFTS